MQQVTQFNLNLNVSLFLLSQLSFFFSHEMRIFLSRVPSTSCTTCYLILSSFRIPLKHTSEIKTMMMMSLKGVEWNEGENSVIKSCTHKTFDLWFCNFVIHSRLPFPTTYLKRFSDFLRKNVKFSRKLMNLMEVGRYCGLDSMRLRMRKDLL